MPDRRTPRRSFASLRPETAKGQVEICDDLLDVRTLRQDLVPEALLRLALSIEERLPGPRFPEGVRSAAGSAHARLDATVRLAKRLALPTDHPLFDALRRP